MGPKAGSPVWPSHLQLGSHTRVFTPTRVGSTAVQHGTGSVCLWPIAPVKDCSAGVARANYSWWNTELAGQEIG